jgi:hypothetical protein
MQMLQQSWHQNDDDDDADNDSMMLMQACRGRGDGHRYNTNDDIQTGNDRPTPMLWHVITRNDNNYKWTDWLLNGWDDVSLLWVNGWPKVYFIENELSPSLFCEISLFFCLNFKRNSFLRATFRTTVLTFCHYIFRQ